MGAFCHIGAGRYASAIAGARQAVLDSPTQPGPQLMLAAALWQQSQIDEVRRIVRENAGRTMFTQQSMKRLFLGTDPTLLAARDRFFAALQELGVP